ncbi:phage holin family protein [Pseudomonas sp.]|uniref:phage holin family protein n=1 Tax=Pseudomonas sp. TaxID=306 RepID=UPI0028B1FC80|nr:phage holin family protein [Pseudomonas sp.]
MDSKHADEAPTPSIKKMGSALAGLVQGHLELIGIEIQEERARVFKLFLLASVSFVLGLLILVGLSAAIVIAFWDSNPIAAILVLCALYGIVMAICISRATRIARESASPFQATVEELARNRERLLP